MVELYHRVINARIAKADVLLQRIDTAKIVCDWLLSVKT